jgi:RNA polymerase sigma-70 factor (ECF subfamily)
MTTTNELRGKEIEITIAVEHVHQLFKGLEIKGLENGDGAAISRSLKPMTDEWLILAAKNGNTNAFAELRDRHSSKILRTTYRITRNREDAEDALQDSFLNAFVHLNKFEGRSSFSSWVTRIAINMSLMAMRKKRRNKELSIDPDDNDFEPYDSWEPRDLREDPECRYARHERAELLRRAIRRLSPALRTAVELQQARDYSMQELADSLCISLAAAKSRLLRARLSIRTLLHDNNLRSYQSEGERSIGSSDQDRSVPQFARCARRRSAVSATTAGGRVRQHGCL